MTLADVARLAANGHSAAMPAVRDFLDQIPRSDRDQIVRLVEEEPPATGDDRIDALLAALAEHLAIRADVRVPRWALAPERFLDRFWFVSPTPGFRATAIVQTPVALKRRGVMWPERSMQRV